MTVLNVTKNTQPECAQTACNIASDESPGAKRVRTERPRYRVRELEGEYLVSVDLPGVAKDGVELSVADNVLEISGVRSWADRETWKPLAGVSEDDLTYRLRLSVGDEVDQTKISADLDAGMLRVTLAKAEDKKPRRIAVN